MRCPCTVFVLGRGAHVALIGELDLEVGEIVLEHLVLGLHELQLLLEVGKHLHGRRRLLAQLEQLLVALLDLLVERLVLNLELLKVDEVQACDHVQLQAGHGGAAGWVARGAAGWGGTGLRPPAGGAPSASFSFWRSVPSSLRSTLRLLMLARRSFSTSPSLPCSCSSKPLMSLPGMGLPGQGEGWA